MPHLRISMTDPFGLSQVRAICGGPACRDPEGWLYAKPKMTVAIELKTERRPGEIHPCLSGTGR